MDWNSTDERYRSPKLGKITCNVIHTEEVSFYVVDK
jgi:hypothetical protein